MRLWVFKRHFSTIFQLYIDLWATFPGANMVIARNDRWLAHLHIQNGGSKRIWILTYSWMGNFLLAWAAVCRDKKSNSAPVWTISQNITAIPWKLKVPTQFQILKRNRHSKALRRSEKMHPARFSRPKSTFLTIPILVAGTNSVSSGNIVEESFFDKYFAEKLKVPTII